MSTETADRVQAAKLLTKQLIENTAYWLSKTAADPFKIDKRGIGDELREMADRIDRAQDWMGVPR